MRRSSRIRVAWERLRARRKLGTAIAASRAIIATTIMISTRVNAPRDLLSFCNSIGFFYLMVGLDDCGGTRPLIISKHQQCQSCSKFRTPTDDKAPRHRCRSIIVCELARMTGESDE